MDFASLLFCWVVLSAHPELAGKAAVQEKPAAPLGAPAGQLPPEVARRRGRGWNDRRRTVHGYITNLGYDSVRVFSRPNLAPLLVGAAGAGLSTSLDTATVNFFSRNPMRTFGNVGDAAGGSVAVTAIGLGLFSAGRIVPGDTFRSASYDASQAILITTVYTFGLKVATNRRRPDLSNRQSFPSGHASAAFSWATVLGKYYGWRAEVPAYTVASLIGLSRLAHKSHYLSDVVAGATLGHAVGLTVVRGNSREASGVPAKPVIPNPKKPDVQLWPTLSPSNDGTGVELRVSF